MSKSYFPNSKNKGRNDIKYWETTNQCYDMSIPIKRLNSSYKNRNTFNTAQNSIMSNYHIAEQKPKI